MSCSMSRFVDHHQTFQIQPNRTCNHWFGLRGGPSWHLMMVWIWASHSRVAGWSSSAWKWTSRRCSMGPCMILAFASYSSRIRSGNQPSAWSFRSIPCVRYLCTWVSHTRVEEVHLVLRDESVSMLLSPPTIGYDVLRTWWWTLSSECRSAFQLSASQLHIVVLLYSGGLSELLSEPSQDQSRVSRSWISACARTLDSPTPATCLASSPSCAPDLFLLRAVRRISCCRSCSVFLSARLSL